MVETPAGKKLIPHWYRGTGAAFEESTLTVEMRDGDRGVGHQALPPQDSARSVN